MSTLNRLLISAAVAASPMAHREARREQWLADVRDARELDLSPTALAFGALTTALFHRRADHRSTWGNTMTTMPGTFRHTRHTIPTIPVLIVLAFLSFMGGSAGLGLLQRYNGSGAAPVFLLVSVALTIVPGVAVSTSVLLTAGASLRRRTMGAVVLLAITALWWSLVVGFFNPPVLTTVTVGLIAAGCLAVWLVVLRRPGRTWSLLLLPMVAAFLVSALTDSVYAMQLPYSVEAASAMAINGIPLLIAVLAAVVAGRMGTPAPRDAIGHQAVPADEGVE